MKIENTNGVPLLVVHIRAAGDRAAQVLEPGASLALELEPGDSVKARVATEIADQPAEA